MVRHDGRRTDVCDSAHLLGSLRTADLRPLARVERRAGSVGCYSDEAVTRGVQVSTQLYLATLIAELCMPSVRRYGP